MGIIAVQSAVRRVLAARVGENAAVAYHGADTEKYLGEVDSLNAPLLMNLGEEDEFISKAAQGQIKAALASKANATVYRYPGQRHAFARHNGTHYNCSARQWPNERISTSTTSVIAITCRYSAT